MPVQGILWNIDGTLVDSYAAQTRAWQEAIAEAGGEVGEEQLRGLIAMGPAYVLSEGLGIPPHSERGRAIAARREAIFREHYLPRIPAALGAGRLLAMCRGRGLRMAAVTPGDRAEAILLLRRVGLGRHLPRVFGGVGAPEPKADGLAEAVRSFGLAGDGIALVGDSPFAVALAARHGIAAIGLLSGGWSRESLEGAARIYHDTAELLACFAFSPFALPPLREASSN